MDRMTNQQSIADSEYFEAIEKSVRIVGAP